MAFQAHEGWVDRVRAGLLALLDLFDEEPALARHLVVHSAQAGPAVLARRREILDRLALVLDDEHAPARPYRTPLTAHAVVCGALGVLTAELAKPDPGVLAELARPLMSFIALPFLGARAARRELVSPRKATPARARRDVVVDLLQHPAQRLNDNRTARVLTVIGEDPGLNNRGVARRAGVKDEGQISRLLARLERLALIEDMLERRASTAVKAWRLTRRGKELQRTIAHETVHGRATVARPVRRNAAVAQLQDAGARLNNRTVSVLKVIDAEPGLSNTEVAQRIGVKAKSHTSRVLARMARLGVIENTVDAPLPYEANAWRLTASGKKLMTAIRGDSPPAETRAIRTARGSATSEAIR